MEALTLLAAFLLAVIGVARATRLLIHDAYPPTRALRRWWWNQTAGKGGWRAGWALVLVDPDDPDGSGCPFCAAPYLTAVALAVAIAGDVWSPDLGTLGGWWWILAVWASISYLAAMVVLRDEPLDH